MATSGTYSSSFPLDELLDQAIPLAGGEPTVGQDIRVAKRALRLLLRDINTRGIRLSQVDLYSVSVSSAATLLPESLDSILDATIVQGTTSYDIERLSFADYIDIPRKDQQGRPTRFFVDEKRDSKTLYLWPVPTSALTFSFFGMRRAQEPAALTNDLDIHERYWNALVFGLAWHIAMRRGSKISLDRVMMLKAEYEQALDLASGDDRERTALKIRPRYRRR